MSQLRSRIQAAIEASCSPLVVVAALGVGNACGSAVDPVSPSSRTGMCLAAVSAEHAVARGNQNTVVFFDASHYNPAFDDTQEAVRQALESARVLAIISDDRMIRIDLKHSSHLSALKGNSHPPELLLSEMGVQHADIQVDCDVENPPQLVIIDPRGNILSRISSDDLTFILKCRGASDLSICEANIAKTIARADLGR